VERMLAVLEFEEPRLNFANIAHTCVLEWKANPMQSNHHDANAKRNPHEALSRLGLIGIVCRCA